MLLLLIGSFVLLGTAVALIARAFGMSRMRTTETIAQIDTYGFTGTGPVASSPGASARGLLDGLASLIGNAVGARVGGLREAEIRRSLMAAGLYSLAPKRYVGYRVISTACVPLAMLWLGASVGFPPVLTLVATALGAMAGWVTPDVIVRHRMERRYQQIEWELPELIDLLVVTVEAGLGFAGSLQVAAQRIEGPLGEELRLSLQEQSMGLSIEESLRNMLERCETPSMRAFVRSVLQGETLGVSIGQIMRTLAEEMRKRRRANAEERAQKAPIKILFPLIFLIFPAMFIVLLGPAVFNMIDTFGGH
jgi:tight adherence protein C